MKRNSIGEFYEIFPPQFIQLLLLRHKEKNSYVRDLPDEYPPIQKI